MKERERESHLAYLRFKQVIYQHQHILVVVTY